MSTKGGLTPGTMSLIDDLNRALLGSPLGVYGYRKREGVTMYSKKGRWTNERKRKAKRKRENNTRNNCIRA